MTKLDERAPNSGDDITLLSTKPAAGGLERIQHREANFDLVSAYLKATGQGELLLCERPFGDDKVTFFGSVATDQHGYRQIIYRMECSEGAFKNYQGGASWSLDSTGGILLSTTLCGHRTIELKDPPDVDAVLKDMVEQILQTRLTRLTSLCPDESREISGKIEGAYLPPLHLRISRSSDGFLLTLSGEDTATLHDTSPRRVQQTYTISTEGLLSCEHSSGNHSYQLSVEGLLALAEAWNRI